MTSHTARPRTHRSTAPTALICLALLLGAALAPSTALAQAAPAANQIAGTWEVHVQPDPQSGVPPVVNFAALTRDGRIVNVDPGLGTAVGEWDRLHGDSYAVSFHGFIPLGGQILRYTVRATVELEASAGQFTGPFLTEVRDAVGTLLTSFEGTVEASRLAAEPN